MAILYVAGVSITDNPKDVSANVLNILVNASVVIGEERRQALRLLNAAGVPDKELLLINEHSTDAERMEIAKIVSNNDIAVFFSDAGTPCISDPDYRLVSICRDLGVEIRSIPGPSSITAAISVSGIDSKRFFFAGFPPRSGAERDLFFKTVAQSKVTTVFMERPYALEATVSHMAGLGRKVSVSLNLGTKEEKTFQGLPEDVLQHVKGVKSPFVVVVPGISKAKKAIRNYRDK